MRPSRKLPQRRLTALPHMRMFPLVLRNLPRMRATEVADQLGVHRSTVLKWYAAGLIAGEKLPGRTGDVLFDPAEVGRFAEERSARRKAA